MTRWLACFRWPHANGRPRELRHVERGLRGADAADGLAHGLCPDPLTLRGRVPTDPALATTATTIAAADPSGSRTPTNQRQLAAITPGKC